MFDNNIDNFCLYVAAFGVTSLILVNINNTVMYFP